MCEKIASLEKLLSEADIEHLRLKCRNDSNKDLNKTLTYAPNRKYTPEMFEHTSQLINEGKMKSVAYKETLLSFFMDIDKVESYGKQFRAHLRSK